MYREVIYFVGLFSACICYVSITGFYGNFCFTIKAFFLLIYFDLRKDSINKDSIDFQPEFCPLTLQLNKRFEENAYQQDGVEYWLARELQELLGYADWRNFLNAIYKAKESCETTGEAVSDHFVDVTKMVNLI